MTSARHHPSPQPDSPDAGAPTPPRGAVGLLWLVAGAGLVLGVGFVILGLVGWAQGAAAATGLVVAAAGVLFLLAALWYVRLAMTHRRAAQDYLAARRDFEAAAAEHARARPDPDDEHA